MRWWAVLLACIIAWSAHADALDHRLAGFAQVTQRKVTFTETFTASYLNQPVVSHGVLEYQAPDRLTKIVSTPETVRYSIVHNRMTIRRGDDVRQIDLDKQPVLGLGINALRDLLQGDREDLEAHFTTHYDAEIDSHHRWRLVLIPRKPALQKKIHRVVMRGVANRLHRVVIDYANGDRLVTRITGHE